MQSHFQINFMYRQIDFFGRRETADAMKSPHIMTDTELKGCVQILKLTSVYEVHAGMLLNSSSYTGASQ